MTLLYRMFILLLTFFILRNFYLIIKRKKRNRKKYNFYKVKSINLGSSHSELAFRDRSRNVNLAKASQTFYYDYLILKRNRINIRKNRVGEVKCFLTISYFSFFSLKLWKKDDIKIYYDKLFLVDFKIKEWPMVILYKFLPVFYKIFSLKSKNEKRIYNIKKRILKHVEYLIKNENTEFNIEYLEKIIKICQKDDIELILLTTPFKKEYNDYFSDELLEKNFYKIINNLQKKYKFRYFDFSKDYTNFSKEEYFQDDYDHLSEEGAKVFNSLLDKRL